MKTFAVICFLFVFQLKTVNAQELNKTFFEKKAGYTILIDHCDRSGLEGPEFGMSFKKEYENYFPNEIHIAKLAKQTKDIKIKIILGTWCHDSHVQVPRFIKILDQINFEEKNLEIICVDRLKKAHDISLKGLKIRRIPTFIFYKNNEEIGRIVERPKSSLEYDFLKIFNKR